MANSIFHFPLASHNFYSSKTSRQVHIPNCNCFMTSKYLSSNDLCRGNSKLHDNTLSFPAGVSTSSSSTRRSVATCILHKRIQYLMSDAILFLKIYLLKSHLISENESGKEESWQISVFHILNMYFSDFPKKDTIFNIQEYFCYSLL